MTAQLELTSPATHEQQTAFLCEHAVTWIMRMASAKLDGYRIEATPTEDQYVRRTNIMVRIYIASSPSKRARHAMSFNWYHRDKLSVVTRRLENRVTRFVEKLLPKLRTPQDLQRLAKERDFKAQRKAEAEARMIPESDERMARALSDLAPLLDQDESR